MEGCEKCEDATSCQKCQEGLLLSNGNCVKSCPTGSYPDIGKCKGMLEKVMSNVEFIKSNIVECLDGCTKCDDGTTCHECADGLLLTDTLNQCVDSCPLGSMVNPANPGQCRSWIHCRCPYFQAVFLGVLNVVT